MEHTNDQLPEPLVGQGSNIDREEPKPKKKFRKWQNKSSRRKNRQKAVSLETINNDCLREIWLYLNFMDIVNLARKLPFSQRQQKRSVSKDHF